jgi:hypothetical protein
VSVPGLRENGLSTRPFRSPDKHRHLPVKSFIIYEVEISALFLLSFAEFVLYVIDSTSGWGEGVDWESPIR